MYRGSFGFQEREENVRCAWSRIRESDPGLKRPAGATLREVPTNARPAGCDRRWEQATALTA